MLQHSPDKRDLEPDRDGTRRAALPPPKVSIEKLIREGEDHLASAQYGKALGCFERALESASQDRAEAQLPVRLLCKIAHCQLRLEKTLVGALETIERAETLAREQEDYVELAKVLSERAQIHVNLGEYGSARRYAEEAERIVRGTDCGSARGAVEHVLAQVAFRSGDLAEARKRWIKAANEYRAAGDLVGLSTAYARLAIVSKTERDWDKAKDYLRVALSLLPGTSEADSHPRRSGLQTLGLIHFHLGEWREAKECYSEGIQSARTGHDAGRLICGLLGLGDVQRVERDFAGARSSLEEAVQLASDRGSRREEALAYRSLGQLAFDQGNCEEAADCYLKADGIAQSIAPNSGMVSEILRLRAQLALAAGDHEEALALAERAVETSRGLQDKLEQGLAQSQLGSCLLAVGRMEEGRETFASALGALRSANAPYYTAGQLMDFGQRLVKHARSSEAGDLAEEYLREAAESFASLECDYSAVRCLIELSRLRKKLGLFDGAVTSLEKGNTLVSKLGEAPELDEEILTLRREIQEMIVEDFYTARDTLKTVQVASGAPAGDANLEEEIRAALRRLGKLVSADLMYCSCAWREGELLEMSVGTGKVSSEAYSKIVQKWVATQGNGDGQGEPEERMPSVFLNLAADDPLGIRQVTDGRSVCSAMLIPIGGTPGKPHGVLYVDRSGDDKRSPFTHRDINLSLAFGADLAAVLSEVRYREKSEENRALRAELEEKIAIADIVTQNDKMIEILKLIAKINGSPMTILLQGETGTGKQLVARAVHNSGPRRDKPFVTIDCAALPELLLESELFGHIKGSFTGAIRDKRGLLEEADGGTVFLDEIGKAGLAVQRRLLHLLDAGEIRPVGATQYKKLDTRIISATCSPDLRERVEDGTFLKDLYYRLNDICITIPPLRERKDDIPLLGDYFMSMHQVGMDKQIKGFSRAALLALLDHDWPGNVRELEKAVKRAIILAEDSSEINLDLLPREIRESTESGETGPAPAVHASGKTLKEAVEEYEHRAVAEALEKFGWNRSRAAAYLGLSRKGLKNKIDRYGLTQRASNGSKGGFEAAA